MKYKSLFTASLYSSDNHTTPQTLVEGEIVEDDSANTGLLVFKELADFIFAL